MKGIISHLKRTDWILTASAVFLTVAGLMSIYSSSIRGGDFTNFYKQLIFFILGIFAMFLISFYDWRGLRDNSYFILIAYGICILLLFGLLIFAPHTRGIRGWYKLGPVAIDPIEAVKIVLVILLAKYFSLRHVEMYRLKHIVLSGIYVFIPAILIFRQPDVGSVLILIALWFGILVISGIKLRHFAALCLCGIIIAVFSWMFLLKTYQKERIVSFLFPQVDTLGMSWSQTQSKIAIGSGGIFGQGFTRGAQTQSGFLTESHTDFIYSAIAEEFGFIGIISIFIAFSALLWRILKITLEPNPNFCRLFAFGLAMVILAQIFIHVGMNVGLSPVIGISLPFVSYGGSGLLAFFAALGIIQSFKTK